MYKYLLTLRSQVRFGRVKRNLSSVEPDLSLADGHRWTEVVHNAGAVVRLAGAGPQGGHDVKLEKRTIFRNFQHIRREDQLSVK